MDNVLPAAALAVAAGILVAMFQWAWGRHRKAGQRSIKVKRIRDPADPDVSRAEPLYERRVPEEERDAFANIVRWLEEVRDETKRKVCKLEDYFLVARAGDDLAGFAYIHFYPSACLAFFSYLVIDDLVTEAKYSRVSQELVRCARQHLLRSGLCRGVIMEVEEPETLSGKQKRDATARIKHFKTLARTGGSCVLKSVQFRYFQPKLVVSGSEIRMRLMYAPLNATREPRRLHKRDVAKLLEFLADCIYGDHFGHDACLDIEYRQYLSQWKERLLQTVPEVVQLE